MSSARFDIIDTPIAGLKIVQRQPIGDERGFFARFYCSDEFKTIGLNAPIVQINHTLTRCSGSVRGLHFQRPPHAEAKVVSCLRGEVFDVAVDIRRGSSTFLQWHGEILSAENQRSLLIPEGFAHGFQTLTKDCELLYLHTKNYSPEAEGALNYAEPKISVVWPLDVTELSARDQAHPFIDELFQGVDL